MRKVLIADDDASLRASLKLALQAAGYAVRLAANGKEALRLQNESPSDLLITDIFMPEADGFEAIDAFRAAFPDTRIVVMSGGARRSKYEYLSTAALLGADATLSKPFDMDALLRTLRHLER